MHALMLEIIIMGKQPRLFHNTQLLYVLGINSSILY